MTPEEAKITWSDGSMSLEDFHSGIMSLHAKMADMPGSLIGAESERCMPLEHNFGDGLYVRKIVMPAGFFVISKIHRFKHPFFITKGKCIVRDEQGIRVLEAPYQGITELGTKRAIYIIEETEWTTVHATKETDLDKIEEEIIAKDFTEFNALESEV
jgi:hypothetical protein